MKRKPKSLLRRMVETAEKYEDAVRVHGIMYKALDEDRNLQAGKIYDLAQAFRGQAAELDPYVDELITQNHAFRKLAAKILADLKAGDQPDLPAAIAGLEAFLAEEGFSEEEATEEAGDETAREAVRDDDRGGSDDDAPAQMRMAL